ncbi:MAG TPA: hypothetical protein VFZ00_18990 [Solirubrobacter sp.]|nr:hypothetical protein [Solirubrobacter sp.]
MRRDRLAVLIALVLAGCGGESAPPAEAPTEVAPEIEQATVAPEPTQAAESTAKPAVNSVTVDPGDGTMMIGTGVSLYRVPPGAEEAEPVTGTFAGPTGEGEVSGNLVVAYAGAGDLLASGHPASPGALPENLGLMRSRDQGDTWEPAGEFREADYHEIEVVGDVLVAVEVESPDLQVSRDGGASFESRTPPAPPIDVVIDPDDPERWAISTEQGTFVSSDGGGSWRPRDGTPNARLIWPRSDELYSIDPNGNVRVSPDGGESWEERGDVGGLPSAATSGPDDELLVAIVGGEIRRSEDGRRWRTTATLG